MSDCNWTNPLVTVSNTAALLASGYALWSCASKKNKKDINSETKTLDKRPQTAELVKDEKNSNSEEKKTASANEVPAQKKLNSKEEVKKEKKKSEDDLLDVKKTVSKEDDKKKVDKKDGSKKLSKKKLKEEKKEKSKKVNKEKKISKTESDDEDNEQPPEPGSDPRKIWAFKAAKMKCQAISKLHQDKIKGYMPPNCTYTAYEANPDLNRYADVRCIEETRVVLKNHDRDYIHASWMRMPGKDQSTYITTQGPLPETLSDFWHMIYQEKIAYVLMLCTLFEGGVEKCALYYPEKLGEVVKFGKYEITLTECKEEAIAGTILNSLTVINTEDATSEPLYMNHVQVPWWPDQLAPEDARPMIELYKWVKKVNPKEKPICVHCSAGVGRTATFVGIDYATIRIMENPNIEMLDIVREMRAMRFQAVQSHMQFLFLYVVLMEYFIGEGVVERTGQIDTFMTQYKKHAQKKLAKRAVQNQQGEKVATEGKEKERIKA
ncbi:Protein-tyrosine-phosphatase [Caenorhabditis elegans]|uniref:Protein-tyrosine-phosphatase n=1 Tax=Caenorhabditis elegans TaxID=6239 RepID=P91345_CAEEL|nr:Protein-tyrosine-phosphatase [Caenorhabditis elegans]CCD71890.1 Protein-tyrosine-phosphatase [Caenorhabditis elegans]|eukprot:NP_491657.2 Protein-tyrosine-phosphatase [Caenorhabditis elegans]